MDVAQAEGRRRSRPARVLVAAAAACAVLFVPVHAAAQVPAPTGDLPVPTTLPRLDEGMPETPDNGVTPTTPTTPTTAPAAGPASGPVERPRDTDGGLAPAPSRAPAPSSPARRGGSTRPAPAAPVAPAADLPGVVQVVDETDRPAIARLRRVSVPAAQQFGFPLVLGGLVLAFLVVQGRLDARDPKLTSAPVTVDDDLLPFQ